VSCYGWREGRLNGNCDYNGNGNGNGNYNFNFNCI
jgi:hypothetical protein